MRLSQFCAVSTLFLVVSCGSSLVATSAMPGDVVHGRTLSPRETLQRQDVISQLRVGMLS